MITDICSLLFGTKQGKDDYRTCTREDSFQTAAVGRSPGPGVKAHGTRRRISAPSPLLLPPTDQRCVSPNGDRRYAAGFRESFKTNGSLLPIPSCGPFVNCSNPAFLYPFVISYAVKTKVDTDYQANDLPVCIVRLPSPTYPTN